MSYAIREWKKTNSSSSLKIGCQKIQRLSFFSTPSIFRSRRQSIQRWSSEDRGDEGDATKAEKNKEEVDLLPFSIPPPSPFSLFVGYLDEAFEASYSSFE